MLPGCCWVAVCVCICAAAQSFPGAAPNLSELPAHCPQCVLWLGLGVLQQESHLLSHSLLQWKAVGFWLWPGAVLCWKELNSLPNPALLPGFLSRKLLLMETHVVPLQLQQLICLSLLHFVYF